MFSRVIMLLIPLLLGGCVSLEPHYQRPEAPIPVSLPKEEASASSAAQSSVDIPWKQVIVKSELQQVIAMSLTSSRGLREALADIESARAKYGIQRAGLLPTVNAGVEGSRGRSLTSSGSDNSTAISQSYSANLATSSFVLDLFGKTRSLSEAALETYLATEEAAKSTRLTLIADTASAYVAIGADRSNLLLAQQTMESARQSMAVTQKRQQNGVASRLDVVQAETVYQQARSGVASYTTAVQQDINALNLLVGTSVPAALLPACLDDLADAISPVLAGISSQVLLQRPDVQEAEHALKSANANIGSARAAFFPSLTLTASGGVSSSALSSLFSGGAGVWSLAPSLSLPIFDGGANRASLKYSEARKQYYVASYEKTIQTAFKEVADVLARKNTVQAQLDAQRSYVAAAHESYQLADKRYREGVDTYLNSLDAQRTLYTAQQSLISSEQIRIDNLVTLYNVLGGGAAVN